MSTVFCCCVNLASFWRVQWKQFVFKLRLTFDAWLSLGNSVFSLRHCWETHVIIEAGNITKTFCLISLSTMCRSNSWDIPLNLISITWRNSKWNQMRSNKREQWHQLKLKMVGGGAHYYIRPGGCIKYRLY